VSALTIAAPSQTESQFLGGFMNFLNNLLDSTLSFNWEPIFQLTLVFLILVSGPVVIFLLAARGGDL